MKVKANKIHLILGMVVLTQMGCNGSNQQRGQYLYPTVSSQAQDLTTTGDAFRRTNTGGVGAQGNLANLFNNMARGANNPGGQPTMTQAELEAAAMAKVKAEEAAKKKALEGGGATDDPDAKASSFDVNRDDEMRVADLCSTMKPKKVDTDKDTVYDYCEEQIDLLGLDKAVYNGFIISARTFTREKNKEANIGDTTSLQLTAQEKEDYKKSTYNKEVGLDPEEGTNDKLDKLVAVKFFARVVQKLKQANTSGADLKALKELFNITQNKGGKGVIPVKLNKLAKTKLGNASLPDKLGVVTGVGIDAVPFSSKGAKQVSDLTGIEPQSANIPKDSGFMYVAETHVVVPANGLKIRVGNLVNNETSATAGSKAGMFFVFVNNGSEILTADMMIDKEEGHPLQRTQGVIEALDGCQTAHVVIAFFSDKKIDGSKDNLFSENVFWAESGDASTWKPFSQDMLRLQPLKLNETDTCSFDKANVFFTEAADILGNAVAEPTKM